MKLYAIIKIDNEGINSKIINVEHDFIKAQTIFERQIIYRLHKQMIYTEEHDYKYNYSCAIIEYTGKHDKRMNMIHEARKFLGKAFTEVNIIEKA